jgi:hypothetical protein
MPECEAGGQFSTCDSTGVSDHSAGHSWIVRRVGVYFRLAVIILGVKSRGSHGGSGGGSYYPHANCDYMS